MAIVLTIATPTATENDGTYHISVEATATDGAVVTKQTFSTTISETKQSTRDLAAANLAAQIKRWAAGLTRLTAINTALAALKTNIEGRL